MQLHDLDSIKIANQKRHATLNATLQHESLIGPQTLHELAVPNTTMSVREHLPHVQTTSKLKKVASCMVPRPWDLRPYLSCQCAANLYSMVTASSHMLLSGLDAMHCSVSDTHLNRHN